MSAKPVAPLCALTGATGFIGQHLVVALAAAGWRVRLLLRRRPDVLAWRGLPIEIVEGSLENGAALETLVRDAEVVIHLAGLIKAARRADFLSVNRDGAAAVAATAKRVAPGARFVLVSSQAAREPQLSDYAASKRAGEDAAREAFGSPMTILRPPAVYGPGDRETLVFFQIARGAIVPLLGAPGSRAAMIHVGDLSRLIVALAGAAPVERVLTAADGRPDGYAWEEILGTAARAVGNGKPRLVQVPAGLLRAVALAGDAGKVFGSANMLNSQKLREIRFPDWSVAAADLARAPGWAPAFTIETGFADAVAWYRANRWL